MSATREKVDALIRRALDTNATTEEERRSSAMIAVKTAHELGLVLFQDDARKHKERADKLSVKLTNWRDRALAAERTVNVLSQELCAMRSRQSTAAEAIALAYQAATGRPISSAFAEEDAEPFPPYVGDLDDDDEPGGSPWGPGSRWGGAGG